MASDAEIRKAAEDRVIEAAVALVDRGVISSGSGPVAPTFDQYDVAVERARGSWRVVDAEPLDRLRETVEALK